MRDSGVRLGAAQVALRIFNTQVHYLELGSARSLGTSRQSCRRLYHLVHPILPPPDLPGGLVEPGLDIPAH